MTVHFLVPTKRDNILYFRLHDLNLFWDSEREGKPRLTLGAVSIFDFKSIFDGEILSNAGPIIVVFPNKLELFRADKFIGHTDYR